MTSADPPQSVAFMEGVAAVHLRARERRATQLAADVDRHARAIEAARQVLGQDQDEVLIRRDFVKRRGDASPLTTAIRRPTAALPTYLTAVFVAQQLTTPGSMFDNPFGIVAKPHGAVTTWSRLLGHHGAGVSRRAARSRVVRALDALEASDLIDLGPKKARNRYEHFTLLRDDGSDRRYVAPGRDNINALALPTEFFTSGWHLLLERRELAMLLFILYGHTTFQHAGYIRFPEKTKRKLGLSGETYDAIHELAEFGLIEIRDSMPNRRGGKISLDFDDDDEPRGDRELDERPRDPVPYDIALHADFRERVSRPAHAAISTALAANPLPPRLGNAYAPPDPPAPVGA